MQTVRLTFHVTREHKELISKSAELKGMSIEEFLRDCTAFGISAVADRHPGELGISGEAAEEIATAY